MRVESVDGDIGAAPMASGRHARDPIALLAGLKPGQRLQVRWNPKSDFRRDLVRFHGKTRERYTNPRTARVRDELFIRGMNTAGKRAREREEDRLCE